MEHFDISPEPNFLRTEAEAIRPILDSATGVQKGWIYRWNTGEEEPVFLSKESISDEN